MARISAVDAGGANIVVFLDMIASSEIGPALLAASDDGYNVLVGSTPSNVRTFDSYATHPNVFVPACNSTAAGRYQLLHRYFDAYAQQLGLSDFSPVSQDRIAIQQIRECHALPLVEAGQIPQAIAQCARIWASLPGAGYGQHENKLADLSEAYVQAGGTLAVAV